jgi:UDP-2-acetamido-2,6-beta-L-arabino-hexul-4-ose reductase
MRIGITGQAGFVGTHLYNTLALMPGLYERIVFEDSYFDDLALLRSFVKQCDVIVHLAAMNRHSDPQVIYRTNIELVNKLIQAIECEKVKPHVLFSSSTQETLDNNLYGQSKREGHQLLESWAKRSGTNFTCLVIPNVFGEFMRPGYNSFIATFAHKLIHGEQPEIIFDNKVCLIYVGSLCRFIINQFEKRGIKRIEVPFDFERKVTSILVQFKQFKEFYFHKGIIPVLANRHDINLFNTFRSYIPPRCIQLKRHVDSRGIFVETIQMGVGGQVSFSTTVPGITRGNHYHTRKIERFTVIKGKALIQLRKIGTNEVSNFELDGKHPAYVDMPVWFTHNIKNIGSDELYTQFWINEWYNPEDGDIYFEAV